MVPRDEFDRLQKRVDELEKPLAADRTRRTMLNFLQYTIAIFRSIRRYRGIIKVLFKYGFDHLLEYLKPVPPRCRAQRLVRRDTAKIGPLSPPPNGCDWRWKSWVRLL